MTTPNISMPEISVSQATKYVTHNEALRVLDGLSMCIIQDRHLTTLASGTNGYMYIPKATATGPWAGEENNIAHYYNDTWYFYEPKPGWHAFCLDEQKLIWWSGSTWATISG
jgi:hypothetical protein